MLYFAFDHSFTFLSVFVSFHYRNNSISKLYYRRTCIIVDIPTPRCKMNIKKIKKMIFIQKPTRATHFKSYQWELSISISNSRGQNIKNNFCFVLQFNIIAQQIYYIWKHSNFKSKIHNCKFFFGCFSLYSGFT